MLNKSNIVHGHVILNPLFRSKGTLDTGKVAKKVGKKGLKRSDSLEDPPGGGLKPSKTPTNMRRAASPMIGRKTPMLDRKPAKTPAIIKYDFITIKIGFKLLCLNISSI